MGTRDKENETISNNNPGDGERDATTTTKSNPKVLSKQESSGLHRRRTLYLVRHGEALHNVLEAKAQEEAKHECIKLGLSPQETMERMEEARQSVLADPSLKDAPLTERGKQQVQECSRRLQAIIKEGTLHPPNEAMVSPLTRTLQTADILLEGMEDSSSGRDEDKEGEEKGETSSTFAVKAHIRHELQERQTLHPPDTARSRRSIFRYSQTNDRFCMEYNTNEISQRDINQETLVIESKDMLRQRASKLFDLLLEMDHLNILIVSHKGYLRELERGLLGLPDSPLFANAELRVYRVVFTRHDHALESIERVA